MNDTRPSSPCASMSPDTVLASTVPATPSRVTSPEALLMDVRDVVPVTTASADTRFSVTGQSCGTVTVIAARTRLVRSQLSTPSHSFSWVTVSMRPRA